MTLLDLRKLSISRQITIRFKLRNGMDCVISENGVAKVPALKGVPGFNLEHELSAADEFQLAAPPSDKPAKDAAKPTTLTRVQLAAMAGGGSRASDTAPDHDDE